MMQMLFFVLVMLLPNLAQAQNVTLMSEGFEGACATVGARWPAQSYSGFPCTGQMVINTNPAFVSQGSQSLKMIFQGGEIHGGFVDLDWADRTHRDIVITYDTYMTSPFYTGGDESHGVAGIGTKGLYIFAYSAARDQYWGWVPNWIWGGKMHTLGTQGCVQNDNGIPYDSTFFYQNQTPYHQEENKWVRHEVRYKLNTPGQADGLLEEYQTPAGGARRLTTRYTNRTCLDATTSGQMPSDAKWGRIRLYRQYGQGDLYIDNIAVTTDYFTGSTLPPPSTGPPSDTTAPTPPGTPSCTPGETGASCTWSASSDANSPITYSLQYRVGSNPFATGATSTTNSASLNGLSLNTAYDARVIATDPAGNPSTPSATGTFSTTTGGGGGGGGGGGTGTVLVDSVSASASDAVSRSSRSWAHTVGSQANRLLLVCLAAQDTAAEATATASSVTFNGTAMTFVRKDAQLAGGRFLVTELWRLAAPPSGAGTVLATWAGSPNAFAVGRAMSVYGALSTAPINANNGATGFGSTASAAVTSSVDNALMVDCAMSRQTSGMSVGSGQTLQSSTVIPAISGPGGLDSTVVMSTAVKATAGAETMDWAIPSNYWNVSALAVAPEPTAPVVEPTITGIAVDATGLTFTFGETTPTEIRIVEGSNTNGTISSQIVPIASFPAGRFTQTWRDGLDYVCGYPINASGVQNPSALAHRCGSLVGIVAALDVTPPVISNCLPSAPLPHGTTSHTFTCSINKPAIGRWGLSDVAYASLTNLADTAALTISGTVTGLTNGSSTPVYVGAASSDTFGDEHPTVANTTVTIEVAAAPQPDTTPPGDVADLVATNLGQVAELNWSAATGTPAGYQVYQSTGACTTYTPAGTPVSNTTTLVNLAAATVHCWKAKAFDSSNNYSVNFSNVATLTTSGIIDVERPSIMSNLRIANRYSASVLLQWDIGTDNRGTPKALIEQCTVVAPATTCENFELAKTEIVDRTLKVDLAASTTYCWRGKHSDDAGNVSLVYGNTVCGETSQAGTINAPRISTSDRISAGTRLPRPE